MTDPRQASRLRRNLHRACQAADVGEMRLTLHQLYEKEDSPLGTEDEISKPATFAAMVEVALLAQHLAAADEARAPLAEELRENVTKLHRGFGVPAEDVRCVDRAREALFDEDLASADAAVAEELRGTCFEGRVRLSRHM